ncbi:uncharacterized mitochondrial protein AtMg00810-like [Capsicum annuum]|uniref:uncharacterized mitochondrial protein AtMg00810-like n=1 Tax=Capsicum annuum TaxID=4072 RepID=UPI001FB05ED1|nr:uncharacterized mitochondrial protein AtMg00810-like [Capsicum annuum]
MKEDKPISTPMVGGLHFSENGSEPFSDPALYCNLAGALQYICITHPDVSFCVNKLCQFMHSLTLAYFQAMKYESSYLKCTIIHGLHLQRSSKLILNGFINAD